VGHSSFHHSVSYTLLPSENFVKGKWDFFFCQRAFEMTVPTPSTKVNKYLKCVGNGDRSYKVTNSIEQSSFSEVDTRCAGQENPRLVWNPKVHYRVHNNAQQRILNKFYPFCILSVPGLDFLLWGQLPCPKLEVSLLSPSTQVLRQYLKVRDDHFLAFPLRFIIRNHSSVQRHIQVVYANEQASLNKLRIKGKITSLHI
jgi:hypothetical protein